MNKVDAIGLRCPMPLLRTRQAMRGLAAGALLEVQVSDPASVRDLRRFAELAGHAVVSCAQSEDVVDVYRLVLKLGPEEGAQPG